jgi:RHS repeat-associated protein
VRLIIDSSANVKNRYNYKPFGEVFTAETEETIGNPFGFTGQWYDSEIGEYYLRARMYDPHINRFTGRDPVFGKFEQPLTLHKYLYCQSNPINGIDPRGLWTFHITGSFIGTVLRGVIRQSGIVIDDNGNIGWMNVTGHGVGFPLVGAIGVSFGRTNADTIFDLEGAGCQAGGSVTIGHINVGVDILKGEDPYYRGWEITPGWGWPPMMGEIHGFETTTKIYPSELNWHKALTLMQSTWKESIWDVKTVGQGYLYLIGHETLEQLGEGNLSYVRHLKNMGL